MKIALRVMVFGILLTVSAVSAFADAPAPRPTPMPGNPDQVSIR